MESTDNVLTERLSRPFALLLRGTKREMVIRMDLLGERLLDRQRIESTGTIEFGLRPSGALEILRAWFLRGNRPVYFQPKEFNTILKNARSILVPQSETPSIMARLEDFLRSHEAPRPQQVPVCVHCLRDNRLTILTSSNTVSLSEVDVSCVSCAQSELKSDLKGLGLSVSSAMLRQLESQVARLKSLPRVLEMVSPGFDPSQCPDVTLFDRIEAVPPEETVSISTLPVPDAFKEILRSEGYQDLLPIQQAVIQAGLFDGESLLVVSSTSSGKTLIGEMAGIPRAMVGRKMVYLSPLVALTNEKYDLWRRRYRRLGLRTGIRVGMSRLDVGDEGRPVVDTDISDADIICATYEALDLMLRMRNMSELGDVGTVVVDEIQNLSDPERGPLLDGLILRLRYHYPGLQLIGLSATVGSPDELARRLGLRLVQFHGRPVALERHLVLARNEEEKRRIIQGLVRREYGRFSSTGNRGQSIVFTYSRRRAKELSDWLNEHNVSCSVYHGGLSYNKRRAIEHAFARQRFAAVVTTAALGAGVDLPASQVIFESLSMGSEWLSIAEFEQMLGRAGRLGKHDIGRVYLVVQPDRKYHAGQDRTEDQVAIDLLNGVVEAVESVADLEQSAEQVLALVLSTGVSDLRSVAELYRRLSSPSVSVVEAMKLLVKTRMVRVQDGRVSVTELGKAACESMLTPSEALRVLKRIGTRDLLDIAIGLEPFENVYLSSRMQGEIDSAFKTHMPTRFFSGVFHDIGSLARRDDGASRLSPWVLQVLGKWTTAFLDCGCRFYPECEHPKIRLGRWLVEMREKGLNPSGLSQLLEREFELWAYSGDIYSWLDSLIHNLRAVKRIAAVAGRVDLGEEIESQIAQIESPLRGAQGDQPVPG